MIYGSNSMPTSLPGKTRASPRVLATKRPPDWLGLWAVSMGVAAVVMASLAYFTLGDSTGAAFVLLSTMMLIVLVMRASAGRPS
jgi:hypothetical protein